MANKKLNRTSEHRKALLKNMLNSLIKYEQIKTTLPKAKFLKPQADKIITLGKKETLQTTKMLVSQLQDIKSDAITEEQIDQMYQFTNSYEALFSKRARKYKSMGLKDQNLKEEDFRNLILEEYTFLKRPVFIVGHDIFVGNSKKTIDGLKKCLVNE